MGCSSSREADADDNHHASAPGSAHELVPHVTHPAAKGAPRSAIPNRLLVPLDRNRRSTPPNFLSMTSSTRGRNPGDQRWTRAKLNEERENWWDSQTTNDPAVWLVYKRLIELLQEGRVDEAQATQDAAELTCPDGKLWHGIYDAQGRAYTIGEREFKADWIVWEPMELAPDTPEGSSSGSADEPLASSYKGKSKSGDTFPVRVRMSSGVDYTIEASWDDNMIAFVDKVRMIANNPHLHGKKLLVSYMGRILGDYEHLPKEGHTAYKKGNTLSIMIMDMPVQWPTSD